MTLSWSPDDNNRGIQVCASLAAAATVFVLLRIWTRVLQVGANLWWDDWLIILDLPILWAQTGLSLWFYVRQLNQTNQSRELSSSEITLALKCLFAYYHLFNWGISLAKLSALCFYFRVFSVDERLAQCIRFVGILVVLWLIVFSLSTFGECRPLVKAWEPEIPGSCFDIRAWWMANAISDVVIDLLILVLPMPMLWRMHLNRGKKILILLVFVSGYSLMAASIRRVISVGQFGDYEQFQKNRIDVSYNIFPPKFSFWPIYETPWGIISVCLPSIFSFTKLLSEHGLQALLTWKPIRSQSSTSSQGQRARSEGSGSAGNGGQDSHELLELSIHIPENARVNRKMSSSSTSGSRQFEENDSRIIELTDVRYP